MHRRGTRDEVERRVLERVVEALGRWTLLGVIPVWKPAGHDLPRRGGGAPPPDRPAESGSHRHAGSGGGRRVADLSGTGDAHCEYLQELPKRYAGSMVLGASTDTQDQTGRILREEPVGPLDPSRIDEAFRRFLGEIDQVPPMVSAVRVEGRRLYEWAREGKEVPRRASARQDLSSSAAPGWSGKETGLRIDFEVLCSKGTYVRTLCVDIGAWLGYPAHMSRLVRVQSGPFFLQDTLTLEELREVARRGAWGDVLVSPDAALGHFPLLVVPSSARRECWNGMWLQLEDPLDSRAVGRLVRVYTEEGEFCALYRMSAPDVARPEKVFRNG